MSEQTENQNTETAEATEAAASESSQGSGKVKLNGVYAFKEGMATVFNEQGEAVPVTVLRFEPWVVAQVKTKESEGYNAVQLACKPKKSKNASKAETGHLKKGSGIETGAQYFRELLFDGAANVKIGQQLDINSVAKADIVKITARSKGRGFAGSVKRFNFGGGPAAHGSKFHRQPGSSGNRTWPGRVMPGKRFPGHLGDETVSVKSVQVVDVISNENVILVRGPVPGARGTLVRLVK